MMNKVNMTSIRKKFALAVAFLIIASGIPLFTHADEVVLNPGYISGTISITGETISSSSVSASGSSGSASTSTSSGSYTLTVNVPQGSSTTYSVYAYSYLSAGGYLNFPSQTVIVNEGLPATTANFSVNPGSIQATITATSGTVSSFYLYAYGGGGSSNRSFSGSSGLLPVVPSSSVTVYGTAYFTGGGYASLSSQTVSVGAGETVPLSWTVSPPPPVTQGTIAGTMQLNGATVDQHYVYASGPSYGSTNLSGNGSYSIANLNEGNYGVYAYSYFNNYTTYMYYPYASFNPSYSVAVTGGATTNVDISANAAFLNGTLKLTGTKSLSQASSASLRAYGVYQTNSYGGSAGTNPNIQTGAYSLVVTPGSWSPYAFYFQFYNTNPSDYLYEYLSFYDYQSYYNPVTLSADETVTKNFSYGTGSVTVNFLVLGGGTFSYPYLSGNCYKYDQNNNLQSYYSFNAYNYSLSNVTEGGVTFVGMEGTCTLTAYATVGGSSTQFGQLTVSVVPGSQQEVDIGGPALTVTFPEPDYITDLANITVTGTATDDVNVQSVTVNGNAATLTPPAPAPSVNFEGTVSLSYGPNQIQTVATDTSGKTASDIRTVYRDEYPPILNWTPADGSVTNNPNAVVSGTANDDAGIAYISVNGLSVPFTPTGNGNEVSFSVPFTLADGDNFIEVVATDISTRITAQTHKVTLGQQDDTPPVIVPTVSPGPNGAGWNNSNVTVSWSVSDPESGIASSSGCDTTTLMTETAGTTLTCTATNGAGLSSSASVTVKIDMTAPNAPTANVSPTPNAAGWNNSTPVTVSFTSNGDAGSVQSGVVTCTGSSSLTSETAGTVVSGTCTDAAGNTSTAASATVKIDTTTPTIVGSRTPGPNVNGWNNTDVTVSFSCSDELSGINSCSAPTTLSGEGAGQSVTGTAVDQAGNTASATVGDINIDKTIPTIAGLPAAGACTLWPPNHKLVQVATVTASGGGSGLASLTISGSSNEPENGLGDGDTAPDIVITGGNVQLRAERSGTGTGRVYTLTAAASDIAGNQTTATATCVVPHDQRKK